MDVPPLHAVVMAGGSGTRFWPASRGARPKQFLPIGGGLPLIAATHARLRGLVPDENVLVVTAESQSALVREALPMLPPENVLAEPCARNTAPCVALAALEVERRERSGVQIVLPADHVIEPAESFRASLAAAARYAAGEESLVTFGIRPDRPATGYGYIEAGDQVARADGIPVLAVERFVEKPELARAEEFLASGRFLWNAGIFVWSTSAILAALEEHVPETLAALRAVRSPADLARVYPTLAAEPIDVAVLERARNVRTMPIDYRWSDVGSWAALGELGEADEQGNRLSGAARLVALDARDCIAYAEEGHVVALVGVEDLVVVHAKNATLVVPRARAEEVKRIVERLRNDAPEFL